MAARPGGRRRSVGRLLAGVFLLVVGARAGAAVAAGWTDDRDAATAGSTLDLDAFAPATVASVRLAPPVCRLALAPTSAAPIGLTWDVADPDAGPIVTGAAGPDVDVPVARTRARLQVRPRLGAWTADAWVAADPCPGVPDPPTGVAAAPGDRSIAVTWGAPADDGGASVTTYTATATPGPVTCTAAGPAGCTLPGLTAGTTYTVTVTATSSLGTSDPSAPVTAVPWGADRYWVAASAGSWTDPANWSFTSGGPGGAGVPTPTAHVHLDAGGTGDLLVDPAADTTVAAWTQAAGYPGTVTFATTAAGPFRTFTVAGDALLAGGRWSHPSDPTGGGHRLDVTVGGDLTVAAGGAVDVAGRGYAAGQGPGAQTNGIRVVGSHGGRASANGLTYGSPTSPATPGSGSSTLPGGGVARLRVGGTATIDGAVSADGAGAFGAGGGSAGGSVGLTAGRVAGTGSVTARGGTDGWHGSGGGGRVSVVLTGPGAAFGAGPTVSAAGGTGPGNGITGAVGAGTVYLETAAQGTAGGQLVIDAGGPSGTDAVTSLSDTTAGSVAVGSVVVRNGGRLLVGADDALTATGTGTTLTVDAAATLTNAGALSLSGTAPSIAGATDLSAPGSTVTYTGQPDGGGVTLAPGPYAHLAVARPGTTFTQPAGPLTVTGDLTIGGGATLASGGADLAVAGAWANAGTYAAAGNTVTLNGAAGTTQTVSGATTFAGLTATTSSAARTVAFAAGSTQTVTGPLTLGGGAGQLLALRSTVTGSAWTLEPNGSRTVAYVDVRDGVNAVAPTIDPVNSVDSGNTVGWFSAGVAGSVYEDVHYGGGPGRSLAAAQADGGSGRPNVTVELYTVTGTTATYAASTTTDALGRYRFTGLSAGDYAVRVVSATVGSGRAGATGALVPALTARSAWSAGTATTLTDQVGGTDPAVPDTGAASAGAAFSTTTGAFAAGPGGTANAFTLLSLPASTSAAGLDFGYGFDVVTNTNDAGQGSLRQVLVNANVLGGDGALAQQYRAAGVEHVVFMIPNGTTGAGGRLGLPAGGLRATQSVFTGGVATITPTSALPAITTPLVLDAQTQPGWVTGAAPRPVVELAGTNAGAGVDGLTVAAGASVRGFTVNRFAANGVRLSGGATLAGSWLGLDRTGAAASANGAAGVRVTGSGAVVGGTTADDRNVASGNTGSGVDVSGGTVTVLGNYLGTNAAGTAAVANGAHGVNLTGGSGHQVGGQAAGAGNLISGNTQRAVLVTNATGVTVAGNLIGTTASGTGGLGNGVSGGYSAVLITGGSGNTVGGATAAHRNVVAKSGWAGIALSGTTGNAVSGNYVGTDATGTTGQGNAAGGILLTSSSTANTVAGNLVSGNSGSGILLEAGSNANTIAGNSIGLDATGSSALANGTYGVHVSNVANTVIGSLTAAERNVISGNSSAGVYVAGASASGTVVRGNYVGTNAAGTAAVANGAVASATGGVWVTGGSGTVIGGTTGAARNVISGNGGAGVWLDGGTGTTIQSNYIGTDATGLSAVGNGRWGVVVNGPTLTGTTIGGIGTGNVISGNNASSAGGIISYADGLTVQGNIIGLKADQSAALANGTVGGIWIRQGAGVTIGGTVSGQGNVIAGNSGRGIAVSNAPGIPQASIRGNRIWGNTEIGIDLVVPGDPGNRITANNGSTDATQPNKRMNTPVLTRAVLGSNTLGVVGYVGSAALQTTFGGATVDVYVSDASSAYGSGRTYIGTLTANSDGEFAGVLDTTGITGLTAGTTQITATATDASGNTSEFGPNLTTVALAPLTNGGFESGTNPGSFITYFNTPANANALPSWAMTGNSIDHAGTVWPAAEGGRSIDLNGFDRGGLAQVVQTTPGQVYTLTFGAAINTFGGGSTRTLRVMAGSAQAVLTLANGPSGWLDRSLVFTATAEATLLWFDSPNAGLAGGALLDNVRLATGAVTASLSGRVFEDVNYGGGAGRGRTAAGAAGRPNARVELYDAAGAFVSATTTDASGDYAFSGLALGSYTVRTVGGTVTSSRTGATGSLVPTVTYRTDASGSTAIADTAYIGGANPLKDEAASNTGGQTLTALTTASAQAQAVTPVQLAGDVTGVDFGFNFDTVTNTNDTGAGSLRQAITNANALGGDASLAVSGRTTGLEHVVFMIPNGATATGTTTTGGRLALSGGLRSTFNAFSSGVATLTPAGGLPDVTATLVLDAQTQPGWTATANAPVVELSGASLAGALAPLTVRADDVTVRGFVLNRSATSALYVANAARTTIAGNWIGLDATGTTSGGGTGEGLQLAAGTTNATVGGAAAIDRNVISGNGGRGVYVNTATGTTVTNNRIGTRADGTAAVANGSHGVWTGRPVTVRGNVVSGNVGSGVTLLAGSDGSVVQGNLVGTDATGTVRIANSQQGVDVWAQATIGGTSAGDGNLLSGNNWHGLTVSGGSGTVVWGNKIGTDATGATALGNSLRGVLVQAGVSTLTIGGSSAGQGNLISGNGQSGVELRSAGVIVAGNTIGLNAAGTAKLSNTGYGVFVNGVNDTTIGGTAAGGLARNVIAGNTNTGVQLSGTAANTAIQGNWIGLAADGTTTLGNGVHGIDVATTGTGTVIGGTAANAGNVISGNTAHGIVLRNAAVVQVLGNLIGTSSAGSAAAGNGWHGLSVDGGAHVIGDGTPAGRNVISGNGNSGVAIPGGTGVKVQGNWIGLGADGATAVPNDIGVIITGGSGHQIGGATAGQGNVIAGNSGNGGLQINGTSGVTVLGNSFGLRPDGSTVVTSAGQGILLYGASGSPIAGVTIGGTGTGQGNRIAGHTGAGVCVGCSGGPYVSGATIRGNAVWGTTGLGIDLDGNGVTANDGATAASAPNLRTDSPVLTSASLSGTTLSVSGYVGSAPGQAAFANATVDVYVSDDHASGSGSGRTYVGTVTGSTTDGTFSGTITVPGGVTITPATTKVTATATDPAGNTSEFGNNLLTDGTDRYWVASAAGNWTSTANWSYTSGGPGGASVPTAANDVVLDAGSTANLTVNAAADLTVRSWTQTAGYTGTVTVNTTYAGAFQTLTITGNANVNGGSWTHAANAGTQTNRLNVAVGGNLTIGAAATLNVDGKGFGPGYGAGSPTATLSGASYGGIGFTRTNPVPSSTYGDHRLPIDLGSGALNAGVPQSGGGALRLVVAGAATVNGTLTAKGFRSGYNDNNASGGSVLLQSASLSGSGTLVADGGGYAGGPGGGGGRVSVLLTGAAQTFSGFTGVMQAVGGYGNVGWGYGHGAAGTVYQETAADGTGGGTLIVDNGGASLHAIALAGNQPRGVGAVVTAMPPGASWAPSKLTLRNGGVLGSGSSTTLDLRSTTVQTPGAGAHGVRLSGGSLLIPSGGLNIGNWTLYADGANTVNGNVTVASGGVIAHSPNDATATWSADLTITGNLSVQSGGAVDATGRGFEVGSGPGAPAQNAQGAGHGGLGGDLVGSGNLGVVYGSALQPVTLGSGARVHNHGGGAVKLTVGGTTDVAAGGAIRSDGFTSGYNESGGAGGSVWLTTGQLTGSGTISAKGTQITSPYAPSGGGGRVAVTLTANGATFSTFTGTITAAGGGAWGGRSTASNGAAGTVYLRTAAQGPSQGELIIDNLGVTSTQLTELDGSAASSVNVGQLTVANSATFRIGADDALTTTSTGTTLTVASGTTLTNAGALQISGTGPSTGGTTDFTAAGNTVTYTGQADNSGVALAAGPYANLAVSRSGTTFMQAGAALSVTGNLSIGSGATFASAGQNLSVAGNWTNNGTYTAAGNTVTLNGAGGSTQAVSGSTTFANLTAIATTARTIAFAAGSTQTVTGTLTLNGAAGQLLALRSTTPGSTWTLTPSGTRTVAYVDVQDGVNTVGPAILPANSVDSGNTTLWFTP